MFENNHEYPVSIIHKTIVIYTLMAIGNNGMNKKEKIERKGAKNNN